jgi:hypothetical protein
MITKRLILAFKSSPSIPLLTEITVPPLSPELFGSDQKTLNTLLQVSCAVPQKISGSILLTLPNSNSRLSCSLNADYCVRAGNRESLGFLLLSIFSSCLEDVRLTCVWRVAAWIFCSCPWFGASISALLPSCDLVGLLPYIFALVGLCVGDIGLPLLLDPLRF